jgi:hypothetical protein
MFSTLEKTKKQLLRAKNHELIRSSSGFAVLSRSDTKGTKDFLVHNHNTVHKFTKNKKKS